MTAFLSFIKGFIDLLLFRLPSAWESSKQALSKQQVKGFVLNPTLKVLTAIENHHVILGNGDRWVVSWVSRISMPHSLLRGDVVQDGVAE